MPVRPKAGLYLAFPFCPSHCRYCSNPAAAYTPERAEAYLTRLAEDLERAAPDWAGHEIDTVYLGGGTPTLFPARGLGRLLETAAARLPLASGAEITTEANPETVTSALAIELAAIGINRVSLGAQSFDNGQLAFLGRIHAAEAVPRALDAVGGAGIGNVSLDLIFALPGQTPEAWGRDLDRAIDLAPEHLSIYGLTVEEGTELARRVAAGTVQVPDEERYTECYRLAAERLPAAGYARYEISNFARPGRRCRHNLHYWNGDDWLGLGAGAATHRAGHRYSWPEDPGAWRAGADRASLRTGEEHLTPEERAREMAVFGLRTADGIDLDRVRTVTGADLPSSARSALERMTRQGLLTRVGNQVRATDRGFLFHDWIGTELARPATGSPC